MDVQQQLRNINQKINNGHFNNEPDELYEPIRYILNMKGKRLRPLLTLFGCYLFSGETDKALVPSLGVEIFHNFTLVHDDIMDNAPLRRGNKTVHEKWNSNVAILSGDTMLFKAYNCIIEVDDKLIYRIIQLFNKCTVQVCEGQQWDMNFETRNHVSEVEYIAMIHDKTAALLGFSLQLGAIIGGAGEANEEHLKEFGINIGIGFQLKDDLLDVFGDQQKFGKKTGGDITANKKTYLLIQAFGRADIKQKKNIEYWLHQKNRDKEKVVAMKKIYNQIGIKEITENKIKEYFQTGFDHLSRIDCPDDRKNELIKFSESLIKRER